MVSAWYMHNETIHQNLENHKSPPDFVRIKELYKKTGVEHLQVNLATYETDEIFTEFIKKRGYTDNDEKTCSKHCEGFFKIFYTEHLHTDDEVRLILDGSAYFDVRDNNDQWIRIKVTPGDLLVIPSGIYHRFTLDVNNYIKAKRFFIGEPDSFSHNRPAEELECRKDYLKKLNNEFVQE